MNNAKSWLENMSKFKSKIKKGFGVFYFSDHYDLFDPALVSKSSHPQNYR